MEPGGQASFAVVVKNTGPLPQAVQLSVVSFAPGWTHEFSPARLDVAANGGANNTTLVVFAPPSATPGDAIAFSFRARQDGGSFNLSETRVVNLTVVAPPPPPPKPVPKFSMSVDAASGPAGAPITGTLTLLSRELQDLRVRFQLTGDAAWAPYIDPAESAVTLHRDLPVEIQLRVAPPPSTRAGDMRSFTVVATTTAEETAYTFRATWNVTALAAPATSTATDAGGAPGGTTDGGSSSTTTGGGASPTPEPERFGLSATALDETLDIAPGAQAASVLRLRNTGTQTLHLRLSGDAADRWPVTLVPATLELGPGEERDVHFELAAPGDVIPGGSGAGTITIASDEGVLRTVSFRLAIVPATKTETDTTTAPAATLNQPAGGVGISPGTGLLIGGLAAVGAGALALANRPLREKALWVGIGLYTRLARPDILGHPERERLHKLVEAQPGIHFHALQRDLNWNTGTLTYHLRVLERHGFLVSRRDGPYRRFYISGAAPRKEAFNPDAPHGLRADVLEAIRNHHGISQTDLALALGANKQTVNYHVKALERQGTIRIEKRGRDTFLYPSSAPGVGSGEVPA